jgi:hypothetical protein
MSESMQVCLVGVICIFGIAKVWCGNSNALTTATFQTKEKCEAAGKAAVKLADETVKEIKYACIQR